MVPPGGTREKSSGPGSRSSSPKLKCAPTPHRAHGMRPHPAKIPRQIARGPRCGAALHFRRNAAIVPLARSLLDRSSGPFSFRRRSRHGPSGPRRKCGVRRREPLCGATGVYQIKGAPAASRAVGNKREWGAGSTSPWEGKSAAFGRIKRDGGAESTPLGGGKKCGLWPHKKVRPRLRREMISAWKRCFKRCGRAAQIKKAPFWAPSVRKGLQ